MFDDINWKTVILIVVILILITACFVVYRISFKKGPRINSDLSQIKTEMKTGDVLVIAYDSIYASLVKVFNGSYWSHGSFILREKDRIYVIEIARYTYGEDKCRYKGLIKIPLSEWLYYNKGRYVGYCKYKDDKRRPSTKRVLDLVQKYGKVKVNLDTIYWMNTLVSHSYSDEKYERYYKDKKKYFCTEFLANLLQELDMISKDYLPCNYSPEYITRLKEYHKIKIFKL